MKKSAGQSKKKYIDFVSFQPLFTSLLAELNSGRLSSSVLPPVVNPEVLQYTKQGDNVVERALQCLSRFKTPKDADLAGLIADENHTQLAGVLDGQALLSVVAAHYLCKYDEVFATARKHFQKIGEDIRLRIMSDTDTFSMPKGDPTPLHLALFQCLNEDTPDAMGQLAVGVQQSSTLFDTKAKLLQTAHMFVQEVSGLANSVASGPPGLSRGDAVPNTRLDESETNMLNELPPLLPARGTRLGKTPKPPSPAPEAPEAPRHPTLELAPKMALTPVEPAPKLVERAPQPAEPAPQPAELALQHPEPALQPTEAAPQPAEPAVEPVEPAPMEVSPPEPSAAPLGLPPPARDDEPAQKSSTMAVDESAAVEPYEGRLPSLPMHYSPPGSPVQQPVVPLQHPKPLQARPNKRVQFYDDARIGIGGRSSEEDDDSVPVKVSLLPRRKAAGEPTRAPEDLGLQRAAAPAPAPMALDDDDDFDLLKLNVPPTYAAAPAPAARAIAPDSDDDMPELDGK
jgi:hypothetical protein